MNISLASSMFMFYLYKAILSEETVKMYSNPKLVLVFWELSNCPVYIPSKFQMRYLWSLMFNCVYEYCKLFILMTVTVWCLCFDRSFDSADFIIGDDHQTIWALSIRLHWTVNIVWLSSDVDTSEYIRCASFDCIIADDAPLNDHRSIWMSS